MMQSQHPECDEYISYVINSVAMNGRQVTESDVCTCLADTDCFTLQLQGSNFSMSFVQTMQAQHAQGSTTGGRVSNVQHM